MHLPQQIDQLRVHLDWLLLAPVAQQRIDLGQRRLVVAAVHLVGDGQIFVGVDVVERDRPRLALGARGLQAIAAEEDQERSDAAAVAQRGQSRAGRWGRTQAQRIPVRDFDRHVPTHVNGVSAPRPAASAAAGKLHDLPRVDRDKLWLTHC
jgi:hypothetical protein